MPTITATTGPDFPTRGKVLVIAVVLLVLMAVRNVSATGGEHCDVPAVVVTATIGENNE